MNEVKKYVLETEIEGARPEDTISLTERAIEEIKNTIHTQKVPAEYLLRIGTQDGGCSGPQYILGFDTLSADPSEDKEFNVADVGIVIDRKSLFLLQGVVIDYITDINQSGFVFHNPNQSSCGNCNGCGGH